MSASSKKKLRKEQAAANMTEKQKAAKKEARKLKIYTASFWTVLVLCVCLVAGIALKSPISGLVRKMTTAVQIGDHELSAVELNYFFKDYINNYANPYSQYGIGMDSLMGEDYGVAIGHGYYDDTNKVTWADHFLEGAINNAKGSYALCDAANAANHQMTAEESAAIDSNIESMRSTATAYGYDDLDDFLVALYGEGANEDNYREYSKVNALAASYYSAHTEELRNAYTDADLREYEKDKMYEFNSYTYASHYMSLDSYKQGGTKDENGQMTYSDEEIAKAEADLKAAVDALAVKENNTVEALNAAIAEMEKAKAGDTAAEEVTEETTEEKTEETTEEVTEEVTEENTEEVTEEKTEETTEEKTEETTEEKTEETTEEKTEETTEEKTEETTEEKTEETTEEKTEETTEEKTEETTEEKKEEPKYSVCTENKDVMYSSVREAVQEWIRDEARAEGDIAALPDYVTTKDADGNDVKTLKGYYVVIFQNCNDNITALKNVRHILVSFEGGTTSDDGQTTYSDEEKAAAKTKAEELLKEWEAGDKTEDSFAALATEKTTDPGSKETGGLYEDVYPGQMVEAFNDWCFDDARKAGDTGIVETNYGYHVMFFSGDSEKNYRDYMIAEAFTSEKISEWETSVENSVTVTEKNTKYIDREMVLGTASSSTDSHEGHNH